MGFFGPPNTEEPADEASGSCEACHGTGQGDLVVTGDGEVRSSCEPCHGTGQTR
jgi:DnaJ-class molecular chaperone